MVGSERSLGLSIKLAGELRELGALADRRERGVGLDDSPPEVDATLGGEQQKGLTDERLGPLLVLFGDLDLAQVAARSLGRGDGDGPAVDPGGVVVSPGVGRSPAERLLRV